MSLQYAAQITPKIISSLYMSVFAVAIPMRTNPPEIVKMSEDEFTINTHAMERWVPYGVTFQGSKYVIWKNDGDELVMVDSEMFGPKSE